MALSSRVFGQGCGALLAAAKGTAAAASSATASKVTGIQKPMLVSPVLREFLGVHEVSRAGAVKMVWDYIKANNLQNPANKREIQCDGKLKAIFDGKEKVGMMEVTKFLSQHFVKTT